MGNSKSFFKLTGLLLTSVLLISASGCNKPKPLIPAEPSPTAPPIVNDNRIPDAAPVVAPPSAAPNSFVSKFLVDKSLKDDWQAKGITVAGGSIYVSVSDPVGLSKKGSIIKISSDGKTSKDLASSWFSLRHPMDQTVEGVTMSGSNLLAVDSAGKLYVVDSAKGTIKVIKTEGAKDIASGGGAVFVANGQVSRTDSSASSRNPINGLSATGGIGADNQGNVYAVSGSTIKKADTSGSVADVISSDLVSPIDVAVDNRNGDLYVLEQQEIKRFNSSGQLLTKFPNSAAKPTAIAVDEQGGVYISDFGTSSKDSQVIKFSASIDGNNSATTNSLSSNYSQSNVVNNYGTPSYNSSNGTTTTQSTIQSTPKSTSSSQSTAQSEYDAYAAKKRG